MSTKYVIIGAGLFGITLANILACAGKKVYIFEKRDHIGGNCYDYINNDTKIFIHKYGPHIFHIQNAQIKKYIESFTNFSNYRHRVLAYYDKFLYEFPINLKTINSFYHIQLRPFEVKGFLEKEVQQCIIENPSNLEEKIINLVGIHLYEAFFKEYTIKQWGKHPKNLPESIINRIPIKTNYDSGYYKKCFNAMPDKGYTEMFRRMLTSKNISVELGVDFFDDREYLLNKGTVIFTGQIDAFFDFKYGKLEYRSLRFEEELYDVDDWQGISVVNYPELKYEYTRICEPKHFYPEHWNEYVPNKTLIYKEIPFSTSDSEPYYPIQDERNMTVYQKYADEAQKFNNVYFGGRLGEYKYYDMEDTIKSAITLSKKLLN